MILEWLVQFWGTLFLGALLTGVLCGISLLHTVGWEMITNCPKFDQCYIGILRLGSVLPMIAALVVINAALCLIAVVVLAVVRIPAKKLKRFRPIGCLIGAAVLLVVAVLAAIVTTRYPAMVSQLQWQDMEHNQVTGYFFQIPITIIPSAFLVWIAFLQCTPPGRRVRSAAGHGSEAGVIGGMLNSPRLAASVVFLSCMGLVLCGGSVAKDMGWGTDKTAVLIDGEVTDAEVLYSLLWFSHCDPRGVPVLACAASAVAAAGVALVVQLVGLWRLRAVMTLLASILLTACAALAGASVVTFPPLRNCPISAPVAVGPGLVCSVVFVLLYVVVMTWGVATSFCAARRSPPAGPPADALATLPAPLTGGEDKSKLMAADATADADADVEWAKVGPAKNPFAK